MSETVVSEEPAESVVSLEIDATPEDVWQALTTESGLADWMGAGSVIGDGQGDDLYVHDIVTGQPKRGVLDEVSPEHRLGYTWWPETQPDHATRVAITLTPCEVGTRVTVVETLPIGTPVAMASASAGAAWQWRAALVSLISVPARRARSAVPYVLA